MTRPALVYNPYFSAFLASLMSGKVRTICVLAFALCISAVSHGQFYNGMHMRFGKNRIQYREFDWQKYEFDRFTVFFYSEGKNLAAFTAKNAQEAMGNMEKFFNYSLGRQRIQFVVYQKIEHFRQSNVGIPEDDESNIGGTTRIAGNKIFLYFDGDLNSLRNQIEEGIAEVMLAQMMFGDNWKEVVKNAALLSFPAWYTKGLVHYAAEPWTVEADDRLRDLVLRDKFRKMARLKGTDAELAGRAIWYYIGETYGSNVIPNILYMARVSRDVESGFLFVLGVPMKTVMADAEAYFRSRYKEDVAGTQMPENELRIRARRNRIYTQAKTSNDGRYIAYVSNNLGKVKLWLYDTEKNKRKKLFRHGHRLDRINDQSYPILDWNPANNHLSYIMEKRGRIWLHNYNTETEKTEKKELFRLEKVLEMAYAPDGKRIIFSAIYHGQTDLYLYSMGANVQQQLTKDIFDDRYPAFLDNGQVIFSSNRTTDTVNSATDILASAPNKNYDLYQILPDKKIELAEPLTVTPQDNEIQGIAYTKGKFAFLSDNNGIYNRYIGQYDSTIAFVDTAIHYRHFTTTYPVTNRSRNILRHDISEGENKISELYHYEGRYKLFDMPKDDAPASVTMDIRPTNFKSNQLEYLLFTKPVKKDTLDKEVDEEGVKYIKVDPYASPTQEKAPGESSDRGEIDIQNYEFEPELIDAGKVKNPRAAVKTVAVDSSAAPAAKASFQMPEQRNYFLAFAATDVTVKLLDFDYATELYQLFNGGPYVNPRNGIFTKVGMLDVFEDYKVEGGFRFSYDFSSSLEYFISLEDRSRRMDKKYIFNRQTTNAILTNGVQAFMRKTIVTQGSMVLKYPFNEVMAVQGTVTLRHDRGISLATDATALQEPDLNTYWTGLKLEYIFDNTLFKSLNILNGVRSKAFVEHYRQPLAPETDITIVGLDVRAYQPIHRDLIWANRFATSTSFGARKLVYYMGAVDNWWVLSERQRFDFSTNIARNEGYYFQTIATNMRGFIQNARNGNNMAVINSELRWPFIRYFTNRPIKSEFLANLQAIGFADVGTAWNGPNPYSDENAFNQIVIDNKAARITLRNQNDPIIGGVGTGLRATVWGYFVRVDYAWGIENGVFLEPVAYLSMGLDF